MSVFPLTDNSMLNEEIKMPVEKTFLPSTWSTVKFFSDSDIEIDSDTPFVCDGALNEACCIDICHRIELVGVGFLGPIESDAEYDVRIIPQIWKHKSSLSDSEVVSATALYEALKERTATAQTQRKKRPRQSQGQSHRQTFTSNSKRITNRNISSAFGFSGAGLPDLDSDEEDDEDLKLMQELKMKLNKYRTFCGLFETRVHAKKGQVFHFVFDKPIIIEPSDEVNSDLIICSGLKGPNTPSLDLGSDDFSYFERNHDGVKFKCYSRSSPLVELLFNKL